MIHYYTKNTEGKDFVCGDIHGCFTLLEEELEKINFDRTKDRLFSVGDLTDRGKESERAYEFITQDWFIPVQGNHEKMVVENDEYLLKLNGGKWFLNYSLKNEYRKLVTDLPIVIKIDDVLICHSLIPFKFKSFKELKLMMDIDESEKLIDYIQWERNSTPVYLKGIKAIYAGHTINKEITFYGSIINLDTGAFLKDNDKYDFGKLTIQEIK